MIGDPSNLRVIRKDTVLARIDETRDFSIEETVVVYYTRKPLMEFIMDFKDFIMNQESES